MKHYIKSKNKMRRNSFFSSPFNIMIFLVLAIYSASLIIALLWGVLTSLKYDADFAVNKIGLPKIWMFKNYIKAFEEFKVGVPGKDGGSYEVDYFIMFLYSLISCGENVIAATLAPCIVAYIVCKYKFKFLKVIYYVNIVVMILPIIGSLPSEFQFVNALGIYQKLPFAWILKFSFCGVYFLVFYSTFKSLSNEYAEAAYVDGASEFTVMVKIMFPLVLSTIGVVALMLFIGFWNDYMTSMIYFSNTPTLALGLYLYRFNGGQGVSTLPMQLTGSFLVIFPIILLFLFFHDKLMGNLTIGGLKG